MKSVRIFYTKHGRMKFLSHLDMNRFMVRIIRKAGLPVWYTEGFNRHLYINYAVPLSLGFEGAYEVMDIRLIDDNFPLSEVIERLNAAVPEGIEFLSAAEPVLPTKDIAFAEYEVSLDTADSKIYTDLGEFLNSDSVVCLKKDKKGRMKEFDIIPKIKSFKIFEDKAILILSSGNEGNLNPSLVMSAFFEKNGIEPIYYTVKRIMIYDGNLNQFK